MKLFAGHVAPNQMILAKLERHQKAHLEKLSPEFSRTYATKPNNRKLVAMSSSVCPHTYTLFGKISGSFNWIISIFEPINRPY
ncbi:hypothetical protein [Nostoc sp. WHI]|uniref:hypothetical protein n=1 Tax=Nostoc sp. WHI TaxID=2650611 RepID=UPI001E4CC819|nr:hypothetical protein [Nostoc sp. WHI]